VALNKLADLVDDSEGVQVALALGLAPRKQAVAAKDDAVAAGIVADCAAHHEAQLKAGALPGNPYQGVVELAVELVHFIETVGGGGERDAPVGMKVIDMREGKKAVQRSVDGGGHGIVAEGGDGVHGDHVVFGVDALVAPLQ